jgi:hypothetical protein
VRALLLHVPNTGAQMNGLRHVLSPGRHPVVVPSHGTQRWPPDMAVVYAVGERVI